MHHVTPVEHVASGGWVSQAKVDPSVMLRTKILATKAKDQRKASTTNLGQRWGTPLGDGRGPRLSC